ncbi:MAG TPA: transposase [Anaerolineae bacterium]|nr:transposase [Anaerolineae bacterium]
MAKYKPYCYGQGQLVAIMFSKQIQPGTFEFTLNHLIDSELDLSGFDQRFKNDETGAPAFDPRILLKIILFAYSRGITSSRKIAQCCVENVIFMALSANSRPHFTTISNFISSMDKEAIAIFREVLLLCDEMGLIGKEMFAIDGCKLPSTAAKEWSGTREDFKKKAAKMEKAIESMVERHHASDHNQSEEVLAARDRKYVETLRKRLAKIRNWLDENDDKPGRSGKARKSNITDNDSAKMKTSRGVIQGYDGVTAVDGKHQIIVHAGAYGQGQEQDLLEPMIDGVRENFEIIGKEANIFTDTKLAADSGFHSAQNMEMLSERQIDAYVADTQFRKRDPRFADVDRYKERSRRERVRRLGNNRLFTTEDFSFATDLSYCLCPAGKRLYRSGGNVVTEGLRSVRFKGPKSACLPCSLRAQCLRHPERTEIRQVAYFHGRTEKAKDSCMERMKRKIDSAVGRALYAMRLAVAEPPFAHICRVMGLDRFTLRGKEKVNSQWQLFCTLHNLKKLHRYGEGFA